MITLIILNSHAYALSHFRIFKFCMFLNHGSTSLKGASKPYDVLEHHCPCSIQADNLEKRGWTIHSKWMIPITSRHQTSNTHPSMPWSFFFFFQEHLNAKYFMLQIPNNPTAEAKNQLLVLCKPQSLLQPHITFPATVSIAGFPTSFSWEVSHAGDTFTGCVGSP